MMWNRAPQFSWESSFPRGLLEGLWLSCLDHVLAGFHKQGLWSIRCYGMVAAQSRTGCQDVFIGECGLGMQASVPGSGKHSVLNRKLGVVLLLPP